MPLAAAFALAFFGSTSGSPQTNPPPHEAHGTVEEVVVVTAVGFEQKVLDSTSLVSALKARILGPCSRAATMPWRTT